jgi:hypothetical protein
VDAVPTAGGFNPRRPEKTSTYRGVEVLSFEVTGTSRHQEGAVQEPVRTIGNYHATISSALLLVGPASEAVRRAAKWLSSILGLT